VGQQSNGKTHPDFGAGIPNLGGPVQEAIRAFGVDVAKAEASACILIAINPAGAITWRTHAPGGLAQLFGMMELAKLMIADRQKAAKR
jgi:hypothetical protein